MISHEEDFDKANIILTIDNQRGLQALFDYIIYLGIKVILILSFRFFFKFIIYLFIFSQMKFYPIFFNQIVFILILV